MPLPRIYHGPDPRPAGQIDWRGVKLEILGKLGVSGVAAAFQSVGVRFATTLPKANGVRPCYAIGREPGDEDETPSAAVNCLTGLYWDKGGSQECLPFFDFAVKYGSHSSWLDA